MHRPSLYILFAWKSLIMRTEHVKRNIDTNKAVRKTYLANCFFYALLFPLVEFCSSLLMKKNINKKGDASQWSISFGFCCMSFPFESRDFISKNTFIGLCRVARQGASYRLLNESLASVEAVAVLLLIAHFYIQPMPKHIVW